MLHICHSAYLNFRADYDLWCFILLEDETDSDQIITSFSTAAHFSSSEDDSGHESQNVNLPTVIIITVGVIFGFCLSLACIIIFFLGIFILKRPKAEVR